MFIKKTVSLIAATLISSSAGMTQQMPGTGSVANAIAHQNPEVRKSSLRALFKRPPKRKDLRGLLPHYVAATRDNDPEVRNLAVQLLWRTGMRSRLGAELVGDVLPAIAERLRDSNPKVRALAARVVAGIKSTGKYSPVPDLQALALSDNDPGVAVAAVSGLSMIYLGKNDVNARKFFLKLLRESPKAGVRGRAATGLARMKPNQEGLDAVIAALKKNPNANEQQQILEALANMGPYAEKALPLLEAMENDSNVGHSVRPSLRRAIGAISYELR